MQDSAITQLLVEWRGGDSQALERLMPLVYEELRTLASHYLRREQPGHTLQSTALVHEAYLRLVKQPEVDWQNRSHFFGIASKVIRQILVDHARGRMAAKRDGIKLAINDAFDVPSGREVDLVKLDDALHELSRIDEQQSRVVELRFFGGLSIEETAEVVGVSPRTVKREWSTARAWLFRELCREGA